MNLWIRSQDKKHLIRATNIDIAFNGKIFVNEVKFDNVLCVGNYLGEERALEVLDEIQKKITNDTNELLFTKVILEDRACIVNGNVYEMPKE